jgi:type I restriction enzyme R subunit
MPDLYESDIEKYVIELLQAQGYEYLPPEKQEAERSVNMAVLRKRLEAAIDRLNPSLHQDARDQALRKVLNHPSQNLLDNNEAFHQLLTDGIEVEVMGSDGIRGERVRLMDFDEVPTTNLSFAISSLWSKTGLIADRMWFCMSTGFRWWSWS